MRMWDFWFFVGMEEKPILEEIETGDLIPANKLNQLDRIKGYYLENQKLELEDEVYRILLQKIFHWFEKGKTPADARKILQNQQKFEPDEASKAVADSLELYGDIGQSNREGLRHLLTNHFLRLANAAEKAKNLDLAAKTLERVARINNMSEVEDTTAKKGGRRIQISYTTNPEKLKKAE